MTTFASKADMVMEPRGSVDLGSVAVGYQTPKAWQHSLGGLALINGTRAQLKYKLERDGGAAAVDLDIKVKTAAGVVIHTETLTGISAGAIVQDRVDVDVGGVSGGSPLLLEVDVNTEDAGTTATLDAAMSYETPIVIGGC